MFDAMDFLNSINFIRLGGSDGEKKAAQIIKQNMKKIGLKTKIEEFDITAFEKGKATLEVLEPYKAIYEGFPIGYGGDIDETFELYPIPVDPMDISAIHKGKCILSSKRAHYKAFENLKKFDIPAIIMINPPYRKPQYTCSSIEAVEEFGKLPGISLSYDDCLEIASRKATRVRLIIEEKSYPAKSRNVIGTLPMDGVDNIIEDEEIIVCGHFDSVATSPGMIDNATGVANVLMMAERFTKDKPRRRMKFIAFGSEELGLRGSKAYIEAHKEDLDKIRFIVNIDIAGDILGTTFSKVTGPEEIKNYLDSWKKIHGFTLDNSHDIYSSDNMPFCKMGIPAVSFGYGRTSGYFVHWSGDTIEHVSQDALDESAGIIEKFIREIAFSEVFPFERKIPEKIQKKVDEYFGNRWNGS